MPKHTSVLPVSEDVVETLDKKGKVEQTSDGFKLNGKDIILELNPEFAKPKVKTQRIIPEAPSTCHIKAGAFYAGEKCEVVLLTNDFEIGEYEVTQKEFFEFVTDDGYKNKKYWCKEGWELIQNEKVRPTKDKRMTDSNFENHPVVNVSWYEARAYCAWLQEKIREATGKKVTVDLPWEAEWEYAARGTDKRIYPWGDEKPTPEHAAYHPNVSSTVPVDSYPKGKSPWGVMDMAGNVWEWCMDEWNNIFPTRRVDPFVYHSGDISRGVDKE